MKTVICTFGNYPMSKGFDRYKTEAAAMGVFDKVYTYDEKDIDKPFLKKYGRHMYPYSKGYGYWSWKPYLLKKTLDALEADDILVYTDLGCFFNIGGLDQLHAYFDTIRKSPSGMLGFRSQEKSYNGMPEILRYDHEWTKGDIFDYFGVRNDKSYTHTPQFEATVIIIRKCEASANLINEWYNAITEDTSLITDSPSRSPNLDGFKENRHDQSIFSVLAKKYQIEERSTNEICPTDENYTWSLLDKYPIHARRDLYYSSAFVYKNRLKIRRIYDAWWGVKYFFKNMINSNE